MHVYAMSYDDMLAMPLVTFWELTRNVERIRAEEDLRFANLLGSMFSKDAGRYQRSLQNSLGDVVTVEEPIGVAMERLRRAMGVKPK